MNRSIVRKNFILSMFFGLIMGCIFPLYATLFATFETPIKLIIFSAGCIIAGLLVGLISFLITKYTILKVVKKVGEDLGDFNSGELDLTNVINLESDDVVGVLVREFNSFIQSLGGILSRSQKSANETLIDSNNLKNSMDKVNGSVRDIVHIIESVNSATNHQKDVFTDTKEGLDHLNRTVLLLISHVLELFTNMDELTKELLDQSDTLDNLINSIGLIVHVVRDDGESDHNLYKISSKLVNETNNSLNKNLNTLNNLAGLISKIEEISERTGTLSINASIEAARSGKEGEGFKVLAQEVRKLAEHSSNVSKEITISINESELEINETVDGIKVIMNEYETIINELNSDIEGLNRGAIKVKTSSSEVKSSYGEINGMLQSIKESLTKLKTDISNYKESLLDLENSTESIRVEMEEAQEKSSNISEVASKTSRSVDSINSSVSEVSEILKRFKANRSDFEEHRGDTKG